MAFAVWYMSMDLTPLLFGHHPMGNERQIVSVGVGLGILAAAYVLDLRAKLDFAFWFYLFGMMAFWGGLTAMNSDKAFNRLVYALLNLGFIGVAVILRRRVFLVFGALDVFAYLSDLAWNTSQDSLVFPFALSAMGLGVIAAAVAYQKNRATIERTALANVPPWLVTLLPPRARPSERSG
ncbi:MAG TPA: hypothetical protein VII82_02505 [Polyangiaceae bacterium]